MILIGAIIVLCVLVFLVAVVWPRISYRLEGGAARPLTTGQRAAGKAPGPLGRFFQKPFSKSRKAVHKSGSAGREVHRKLD